MVWGEKESEQEKERERDRERRCVGGVRGNWKVLFLDKTRRVQKQDSVR